MNVDFIMSNNENGLNIRDDIKWESSEKFFKFEANVRLKWTNSGLAEISEQSRMTFFGEVIKQFRKNYDKMVKAFTTSVQKLLKELEKQIKKMVNDFKKKHAKKAADPNEVKKATDQINSYQASRLAQIQKEANALFRSSVEPSISKAFQASCKKIQEGATLKKQKSNLIWGVLKILIVGTAIAFAAIATIATMGASAGLAAGVVGLIALAAKAVSTVVAGVKDIKAYAKQFQANVDLAASEIVAANKALERAEKALTAANKNHEVLLLKTGEIKRLYDEAASKFPDGVDDKQIKDARNKLKLARIELLNFEKKIGDRPTNVLATVKASRQQLSNAKTDAWNNLDKANRWADLAKNCSDVLSSAVKAFS